MRLVRTLMIAAALIARASVAHCAWTVDADGACVRKWAPSDLLRGPTAIASALLLPARTLAGGAQYAWNKDVWWPSQIALLGPSATLFCGVAGVVEGAWWASTGVADILTGGYFEIAPERATQRSVRPELPPAMAETRPTPTATEDPCGRPLAAAK